MNIRQILENNPLASVVSVVITAGAVVFGVSNYFSTQQQQNLEQLHTIKIETYEYNLMKAIDERDQLRKQIGKLKKQLSKKDKNNRTKALTLSDFKVIDSSSTPPCEGGGHSPVPVKFQHENGLYNLALLRSAIAKSSSLISGYPWRHRTEYLNDGWYNNCRSWIPASMPSWAKIDLGAVYEVHKVAFGSEHNSHFGDRAAVEFEILTSTTQDIWSTVKRINDPSDPIRGTRYFNIQPVKAQFVRINLIRSVQDVVRIDELEVIGKLATN